MRYWYVLLYVDGGNTYVVGAEMLKSAALQRVSAGFCTDYLHWDVEECGTLPTADYERTTPWTDTLTYAQKRRSAYRMESDFDYITYKAKTLGDGDDENSSKQVWVDARTTIKTKYPKPV